MDVVFSTVDKEYELTDPRNQAQWLYWIMVPRCLSEKGKFLRLVMKTWGNSGVSNTQNIHSLF